MTAQTRVALSKLICPAYAAAHADIKRRAHAEYRSKRMGLFTEKEESMPAPIIIDNISEEVNA